MTATTVLVAIACFLASLAFALGCKHLGDRNYKRWKERLDEETRDIQLHLQCAYCREIAASITDPAKQAEAFAQIEQTERELGVVWPVEVL